MSWRDRFFFVVPIPGMLVLMVFGALVLFAPLLIPLLLLFLLGRALFKWRPWLGPSSPGEYGSAGVASGTGSADKSLNKSLNKSEPTLPNSANGCRLPHWLSA